MCKINDFSACTYFTRRDLKLLQHRKGLDKLLLSDHFDETVIGERYKRSAIRSDSFCTFASRIPFKKFVDGNWKNFFKTTYQKLTFSTPGCKKVVRNGCKCTKGVN